MKKTKEGISIIALVSAVAIILILLTTVTVSGLDTAHNAKKIAFGSEIKMIQGAVDSYYTQNNATYPIKENAYDFNFANSSSKNQKIFQDNEGKDITAFTTYEIDCEELGITNLTYGKNKEENDVYVLSRSSGKVYYLKGLKIGRQTYYTVTDDIENLLSYNSEKNTVNSPVVKFEPSTTDWTNESIEIKIVVPPSTCTLSSVSFNNEVKTLTDSKLDITENGTLIVNYVEKKRPEVIKEAQYIVSNIDKVDPEVEIDKEELVEITTRGDLGYIKIKEKSDNLSGIKYLKYEYGEVTDYSNYFKTSGQDVKEDIIFFKEKTEPITIYAEDNAGNKSVQKITPQGDIIKDPVIPNGFEYLTGTVNTGYVIKNIVDGNEFVWVPVDNINEFVIDNIQNSSLNCYEPYTENSSEVIEYNAMYESVKEYGGFYIARYEASKNFAGKAQSVANKIPWNNIKWANSMTDLSGGAVEAARSVYKVESATSKKDPVSTLMYSVQFDSVIRFLKKKNSELKGNYSKTLLNTGSNAEYMQNNIYDIYGNIGEWTMEAGGSALRFARGGDYTGDNYLRCGRTPETTLEVFGFRLAVYIK